MRNLIVFIFVVLSSVFFSCDTRDKTKLAMNKSFKEYIEKNDAEKNYKTNIKQIETLSYEKLEAPEHQNEGEVYEAKIYFVATTSYVGSMKVYNIDDTVTSYFDGNLKMLRMVNTNVD